MFTISALLLLSPFILFFLAVCIVMSIVCWILGAIVKGAAEGLCNAIDENAK